MKSIEDLENEYRVYGLHYFGDYIDDRDLIGIEFARLRKDCHKMGKEIYKMLMSNEIKKIYCRFLSFIFGTKDLTVYLEKDEEILNAILSLFNDNLLFFDRIEEYMNDDNYMELIRLLDFQIFNFYKNYEFLVNLRKSLSASLSGYSFNDYRYEDTRLVFYYFMNSKLNKYKYKGVEKRINM